MFSLQIQEAAKSSRRGHHNPAIHRAAAAGQRANAGPGAQRLQAAPLRLPRAGPVLPKDLRLQVQEDPRAQQMNAATPRLDQIETGSGRAGRPRVHFYISKRTNTKVTLFDLPARRRGT